jgi:hypothetical protein
MSFLEQVKLFQIPTKITLGGGVTFIRNLTSVSMRTRRRRPGEEEEGRGRRRHTWVSAHKSLK